MYLTCSDDEGYLGREKSTLNNEWPRAPHGRIRNRASV